MSTGGDGQNELAIAIMRMRAAAQTLGEQGGLSKLDRENDRELRGWAAGAFSGLLVLVALIAGATYAPAFLVPMLLVAAVIFAALAAFTWSYRRRRLASLREDQLRAFAEQKLQEKNHA